MGTDYWGGLLDWMRERMAGDGKISAVDLELVCLTDDVDVAVRHIVDADTTFSVERDPAERAAAAKLAAEGGEPE
jgi:hypothetical protein